MAYAQLVNGTVVQYPLSLHDVQKLCPATSFPYDVQAEDLKEHGFTRVENSAQPSYDYKSFRLLEGKPEERNGIWRQTWLLVPLSPEEKASVNNAQESFIRKQRNEKLADSDWTQLPDSPNKDAALWAAYRQDLRDITGQEGFPWEIEWPEAP